MLLLWLFHICGLVSMVFELMNVERTIPFTPECPHTPVTTANILGVHVIEIPSQTSEHVLARLQQDVELSPRLIPDPLDITLQIELGISRADNRELGLQEQGERVFPLMAAGWMAKAWVEQNEAVKVRVVGSKVAGLVKSVVVVHDGADLHLVPNSVLHDCTERVRGSSFW